MAEPESNLKVKLFISLKKQFPRLPEHVVRSVMKQFNNDKDKCLEELNKNPLNTISSVNNSMQKLNLEIKNTDVSQASVTSKYNKNSPVTSHSPELNSNQIVDFDQYKHVPNSSMIPHITCKTSTTPQRQISVQHIQTSEVDLNSYKYSMPQMYCNYSSSPHNDKLHWPTLQKNADPLVMSTPVASSSQHSTHANIYIEAHPNMNKGRLLEYDHQVSMLHPVTSTLHSPQPSLHGSQPPSPYSPQSVTGNHSPRLVGQYVNSKHSPSTQISQQLDYHQLAESPFKYQFANMHGYAPSVSQHQPPIAINSKTALHYRPTKNTYVHSVNPNVSGLPSQSENLVYPIGTSQDDQAYTKALLNHQRQRYEKLSEDYNNLIKTTQELSSEIDAIQRNKTEQNIPTPADFYKIQAEIGGMLKELDAHNNGQTPIGVLDPSEQQNFYKNMNTGQSGSLFARELTPPPLPPRHPETPPSLPMNDFEGEHWNCAACTFLNHPALEKCEECEFPRNSKGSLAPNGAFQIDSSIIASC
ncbi:TGF-beta-activated kinase 1 and MAP3K7-binding protein 2 isoform X2 [Octopus sinensis]|uniref:TGF-beta-activated kinase 1 and MAP3K7-binding protein 2 isoform X2 n=1 Tax=Octopus sinensis TaxID=2607531 RepID=A0A7E6FK46_9MOLL|nr:TGF-beta-activated kinase 1 and MAP3K7-binding protein 2 isoform X2 [Octopus sinensis]